MNNMAEKEYDLAFSFAGEHRQYVEEVKHECEKLGLKVFYDRDKNNDWWGKNFISAQRQVYGQKTRHFVPFISPEYFDKPIPSDEFESAVFTALETGSDYILPVIIADAKIPADKLPPQIHYLRAEDYTPMALAQEFSKKLEGRISAPKSINKIISEASSLKTPRLTPRAFSKYEEKAAILKHLSQQFKDNLPKLKEYGLIGTVESSESGIQIRVEDRGRTVCGLNIFSVDGMGEVAIGFNTDYQSFGSNSFQGWITPLFDTEKGGPALKIQDFGINRPESDKVRTKEDLFQHFWDIMIKDIEAMSDNEGL